MPPTLVDIGRGDIADALVIAAVVVVVHEAGDSCLESRWQLVDQELHLALEGAVIALDLTVGLGVVRRGDDVTDAHEA